METSGPSYPLAAETEKKIQPPGPRLHHGLPFIREKRRDIGFLAVSFKTGHVFLSGTRSHLIIKTEKGDGFFRRLKFRLRGGEAIYY